MLRFVGRKHADGRIELGVDTKSLGGGASPSGGGSLGGAGAGAGRGAHVHATSACLGAAARGGLARAFRGPIEPASVVPLAEHAIARRIEGLLATAARTRSLAVGADAALAALARGDADLVLVAEDAGRVALSIELEAAVARGRAIVCSTKAELGHAARASSPEGVALVAITDTRLAAALRAAWVALGSVRAPDARGASPKRARPAASASGASEPTAGSHDTGASAGTSTGASTASTSRGPVSPRGRRDGRR